MSQIVIENYRAEWPAEFQIIGSSLRSALGDLAVRIDHIGSTSVAGLAAKDVIDVQITVAALDDPAIPLMLDRAGARRIPIATDHVPPGLTVGATDLLKQLYVLEAPARRANLHVRETGRFNQRYALLCRGYLRAHPEAAAAYAEIKRQLARHLGDDVEAYYDVKDPTFDLFMAAARDWVQLTGWEPPPSDT
jgi:GrpB-like predicted nucleotidyltransferase (UPF0157 family)